MSTKPSPSTPPAPSEGLPAQYRAADHEGRIREVWEQSGAFHADPKRVLSGEREAFCVLIPPPNVTAALHLGHAFNNTLQDILVRAHRMMGFEALWMPGTDHAGIATQAVVERRLREEGKLKGPLRDAMTREEFVAKAQAWKDEYEAKILVQLKAMGCSCDWDRTRFTMDEVCARAVREAFFQLFKGGLIYRGKRLVNWDPVLQTAVADDELEDREVEGKFYYLRYPLVEEVTEGRSDGGTKRAGDGRAAAQRADWRPVTWSELAARGYPGARKFPEDQPAWVTVATTRPETYLGDTAVAINPKDSRAMALRGLMIELPLVGRVIPIVEDDYVVMPAGGGPALRAGLSTSSAQPQDSPTAEPTAALDAKEDPKAKFATGFLKVTPGHDENDYALYQRHKAAMDGAAGGDGRALINVMAPDASISDKHGWTDVGDAHLFVGLSREKARELVLREFQSREIGSETLLEAIKPYTHTVPYSDRSKVPIEPWMSDQWYVKVTDDRLRGEAQRALAKEQRTTATFPARPSVDGDGSMRFYPERYAKTYEAWHDNLRDWCVSRQLWWGHRVPVWTFETLYSGSEDEDAFTKRLADRFSAYFESFNISDSAALQWYWHPRCSNLCVHLALRSAGAENAMRLLAQLQPYTPNADTPTDPRLLPNAQARRAGDELLELLVWDSPVNARDPDVLDTWFSSGVWPMSTMGWPGDGGLVEVVGGTGSESRPTTRPTPEPGLLAAFNPSTVLCTGRDIITLWVSRMVMFNRFLLVPNGGPALRAGLPTSSTEPPAPNNAAARAVARPTDDRFDWVSREVAGLVDGGVGAARSDDRGLVAELESPARRASPPCGLPPFRDVYINSIIQDGHGQRMSKSLGNGVDPLDIVHSHGADAMRVVLAQVATSTQDVRVPVDLVCPHTGKTFEPKFITSPQGYLVAAPIQESPGDPSKKMVTPYGAASGAAKPTTDMPVARNTSSKFDLGRNFCNKLWNASRFALGILGKAGAGTATNGDGSAVGTGCTPVLPADLSLVDRWMLSRVQSTTVAVTQAIKTYQFSTYAQLMYDLMWRDFCDWYLEAIKPTVAASPAQQAVLAHTLKAIVRLLHPLVPFITEAIWERLKDIETAPIQGVTLGPSRLGGLLCTAGWPVLDASLRDVRAETIFARVQALSGAIREVRATHQVLPKRKVVLHVSPELAAEIKDAGGIVEALCVLSRVDTGGPAGQSVAFTFDAHEYRLSDLADAVDANTERERLTKQIADLRKSVAALEGRLCNPGYADRAPPALVQQTRDEKTRKEADLGAAIAAMERLT